MEDGPVQTRTVHILGGGPAGCALAYYLSKKNIKSIIYEAKSQTGGMARSWEWNNFIVDTGPHILHTDNINIENLWREVLGESLIQGDFFAANYKLIDNHAYFFDYPLNIKQIESTKAWDKTLIDASLQKLSNIDSKDALANSTSFKEYFQKLVGDHLESVFFREYPEKVWGIQTSEIIPDWAPKRIRVTSGKEPFYVNEFAGMSSKGTGYLFEELLNICQDGLVSLNLNCKVVSLSKQENQISELGIVSSNIPQQIKIPRSDIVVSTLPVTLTTSLLGKSFDLSFRGILSIYTSLKDINNRKILPEAYNWAYIADKDILPNRITEPTSMAPNLDLLNQARAYIISEICCDQTTKHDHIEQLVAKALDDLKSLPFISSDIDDYSYNWEPYVYPVQSHSNVLKSAEAFSYLNGAASNLLSLGTSANFAYNDIQVIFQKADEMASDISKINTFNVSSSFYSTKLAKSDKKVEVKLDGIQSLENVNPPQIIAEIGINHNGSKTKFLDLCQQAANSGAHIVKFQYFKAKARIGNIRELNHIEKAQDMEENIQDLLDRCQLTLEDICEAKELVEKIGATAMCTAFSLEQLRELLDAGFRSIKVSSMDMNNVFIHQYLSAYSKCNLRLFISTGMSDLPEINRLYNIYSNSSHQLNFLYCISSYPAPFDQVQLKCIKSLSDNFPKVNIGYSDHTISNTAAKASMLFGAKFVEVHYTDDKKKAGPDQILSKTSNDLKEILSFYGELAEMSVTSHKSYQSAEFTTWKTQKKGLYAKLKIKKGDIISEINSYLASPPTDLCPLLLANHQVKAIQDIQPNQPLTSEVTKLV